MALNYLAWRKAGLQKPAPGEGLAGLRPWGPLQLELRQVLGGHGFPHSPEEGTPQVRGARRAQSLTVV